MTPRHPPRALRSLTTPIRPPLPRTFGCGGVQRPPDCAAATASRDAAAAQFSKGNDPLYAARADLTSGRSRDLILKDPRSWRFLDCATTTQMLVYQACLRDQTNRIVREPAKPRERPGMTPADRSSALAAGQGAKPSKTAAPRTQKARVAFTSTNRFSINLHSLRSWGPT
jgi:hypothetical protein